MSAPAVTLTTDTPLLSPARGTPEQALAYFRARGAARLEEVERLVRAYYRLGQALGLNADAIVASADLETGTFQNRWWRERLNAGSLGVTGDPQQNERSPAFRDGEHAATAHVAHWLVYALGPSAARTRWMRAGLPGDVAEIDPRYAAYLEKYGDRAVAPTLAGLAGTYAADRAYAQKIVQRAAAIFGVREDGHMSMKAYRFVGLDRDVWLPADIAVSIRIVDHPRVRSYQRWTGQTKTTWHDTGNPRTTAEGEYAWLAAGRPGGEPGGYNFIFDDRQIIQCVPLDEVTWHAGTPAGNRSWGSEQAWGDGVDFERSLRVGAALHGGLIAAKGWSIEALVPHQYWWGKWCPGQILNRGLWPRVVQMVQAAAAAATAAAGGKTMYPEGMDEGIAARLFGKVKGEDGRTYSFNPNGPVSRFWLEYGAARDCFPRLEAVWVYGDGRKYFVFNGGLILWQANERSPVQVLGR